MYYRVNINLPSTRKQNSKLVNYIEPLRAKGLVEVGKTYKLNLNNHSLYQEPTWAGANYDNPFWFTDRTLAEKFIEDWDELAVKREVYSKLAYNRMAKFFTEISQVEEVKEFKDFI